MSKSFEVMNISRHRLGTDSKGVSTLVTLFGCPLKCKYCINDYCHNQNMRTFNLSANELLQYVSKDDMYYRMTGGGITFGGGEPLLQSDSIVDFAVNEMPAEWNLTIETSLNVEWERVRMLSRLVRFWIIDIKDMNPDIYEAYTEISNKAVLNNLKRLSKIAGKDKIRVRIPKIKGYNDDEDIQKSKELVNDYAGEIEVFEYMC